MWAEIEGVNTITVRSHPRLSRVTVTINVVRKVGMMNSSQSMPACNQSDHIFLVEAQAVEVGEHLVDAVVRLR
jgi:hypothetical protein